LIHQNDDELSAEEVAVYVDYVNTRAFSPAKLDDIRKATDADQELQCVTEYSLSGWPEYTRDIPVHLRKFY
jgi:hypothetical protein